MPKKKAILVTGGSGFIGTKLCSALLDKGYAVVVVDLVSPRLKHEALAFLKLDLTHQSLPKHLEGEVFGIIHLAGKNIFGRWTQKFKKALYDSRILSTRNLVDTVSQWKKKPSVLITASAFGYYGNKGEALVSEAAGPGKDFLSKLCVQWEKEARMAETAGIRCVQIRTAHVLGQGGLLTPLFRPFRWGWGAWFGQGQAWFPWVHIEDLVNIYLFALETDMVKGPLNTAASQTVRQKDFMKAFGEMLGKKVLFSIPLLFLRLAYGGLADTFENSVKMSSQKLKKLGFKYRYSHLKEALHAVLEEK